MKYMSLKNMTEEEKKKRKRLQKNEAQKRYYQKNKDYYKNYSKEWTKQQILDLQKKVELGDHYKHLYSELKKQKDDVVEYIKYQLPNFDFEKDIKARMLGSMIIVMLDEDERMLGEIDE